ncbi:hypothetical protein E8E11_003155 [Didymella keratinophila]|nr:hypothetical protein E8E11_003155 [Didymella keratinophila]
MCDPTYTLLRWPDHDWPRNTEFLASQVLDNDISDMKLNSIAALYSDFRSPSRSAQRDLWKRKKGRMLNPMFRSKHCAYHHDCLAFSKPHLSSRRRRWRSVRDECTDDAYWSRECAELEVRERMKYADLVTLYYNYGRGAEVIERLRPRTVDDGSGEEGEKDDDALAAAQEWVSVIPDDAAPEAEHEAEPEVFHIGPWEICLYPAPRSTTTGLHTEVAGSPSKDAARRDCSFDTMFAYHRNLTGIWELGYINQWLVDSSADPYGCMQLPLMLDCGCCSFNTGLFACSCADFPSNWRSPEDPWQGPLLDCADRGEMVQRMQVADKLHKLKQLEFALSWRGSARDWKVEDEENSVRHAGCKEWAFIRAPRATSREKDDWDVVSELSSTGSWRFVDVT